jgi:tetratricopeptide (TPR) repeat protein
MRRTLLLLATATLVSCVPKKVHEEPILENDDRVEDSSGAVQAAAVRSERARQEAAAERDALKAEALATCQAEICDAVVRGELAIGMTETQVLAATGTTGSAWSVRHAGESTIMMPTSATQAPTDIVGDVAVVQLAANQVSRYAYREPQGVRVVNSPADASTEGRAAAMAETLIREGDDLAARGEFDGALNRYDRASILTPGDPMVDYKIAAALDKALRPIEAEIQYRLFLHRLDLELIEARGEAAAELAEAIALAQQRIIILERQSTVQDQ